ncbi:hypothetical protein ACF0H5_022823 [Mactra antiquata]
MTTSSQTRVLGEMINADLREPNKLISLPANYKNNLYIIKNGKPEKKTTLDAILKENPLPCKVAFADSREVIAKDRTMSTRGLTIIKLTELFDEVYFLGNCVNYGELALNVIQVPFYLSRLTFNIIKGFKGRSRDLFNEYLEKLLLASSFLNYNIPCGNMKIAEYDPIAVHSKRQLSLVQPNMYTDYLTLTQRTTADNFTKRDVPRAASRNVSDSKSTTKQYNPKTSATDTSKTVNMTRTSRLVKDIPRNRPLPPLPCGSASKPNVPVRKLKSESFTVLANSVGQERAGIQTVDKRNEPKVQTFAKEYGLEVRTSAEGYERKDSIPFEPEPDYDQAPERDKQRSAVRKALPILAAKNEEMLKFDDDGTSNAVSNTTEQRGKPPIDVKTLSINDVCKYLTHLNLYEYRQAFRDNMIDGDLLVDIDRVTLCTYFGMNTIEALRVVKFAATGKIPK